MLGTADGGSHLKAKSGALQLEKSSFGADGRFVLFGHNGQSESFNGNQVNGNSDTERLDRVWRVDLTGKTANQTVDVNVDRSALPGPGANFNDYGVYVDADGDFSSGATFHDLSSSGTASITVDDGNRITIARINRTITFTTDSKSDFEPSSGSTTPSLDVSLNFSNSEDLTVDVQVSASSSEDPDATGSGTDYSTCCSSSTSKTLSSGNTSYDLNSIGSAVFDVQSDGSSEKTEYADIDISNPGSGLSTGSTTTLVFGIVDEDAGITASFSGSDRSKNESSSNTFTVTVDLSSSHTVNIEYELSGTATLDSDYERADGVSSTTGTVSFSGGTSQSFDLNLLDDSNFEGDETIVVNLTSSDDKDVTLAEDNGGLPELILTIKESSSEPSVTFTSSTYTGDEGSNTSVTVELSKSSSTDTDVSFSIANNSTSNSDWTQITSSPVTIPSGDTKKDITISLDQDSDEEGDETFDVGLDSATGASLADPDTSTVTIRDDDVIGATGPGGVGDQGSFRAWFQAENGTPSTDGANVSTWEDQSGNDNDASAPSSNEPDKSNSVSALNSQPAVSFTRSNSDYLEVPFLTDLPNADNTVVMVWNRNGTGSAQGLLEVAEKVDTDGKLPQARGLYYDGTNLVSANDGTEASVSSASPAVVSTKFVESSNDIDVEANRSSGSNTGATTTTGTYAALGTRFYDGTGGNGTSDDPRDFLDADVAEVAVYEKALNTAQRKIVANALAAKYGVSLSNDDIYVGDNSGNGDFDFEVAGIGANNDDGANGVEVGETHQRARVGAITLVNNTFGNDEYVFVGDNEKGPDPQNRIDTSKVTFDAVNDTITARSSSVRFLSAKSQPTFDITFDLEELGFEGAPGDPVNYRLLFEDVSNSNSSGNWVLPSPSGRSATDTSVTFTGVQPPTSGFDGKITIGTTNNAASPLDARFLTVRGSPGFNSSSTDTDGGGDAGYISAAVPATGIQVQELRYPDGTQYVDLNYGNPLAGSAGNGGEMIYTWDGTNLQFNTNLSASDVLTNGKGFYLFLHDNSKYPLDPEISFSYDADTGTNGIQGSAPSSDQTVSGLNTDDSDELVTHFLGNPYLTPYDLDGLDDLASNDYQSTVKVWEQNNGSKFGAFVTKTQGTSDDVLSRWQGFFVEQADGSTPVSSSLTFSYSGRQTGDVQPFVGSKSASSKESSTETWARLKLRLDVDGERFADTDAAVLFHEDADSTWDAYDATKSKPAGDTYAALSVEGPDRSGNNVPKSQESRAAKADSLIEVPLEVDVANVSGPFTISIPRWELIPSEWTVTLFDTEQSESVTFTDRGSESYTFDLSTSKSSVAKATTESGQARPAPVSPAEAARQMQRVSSIGEERETKAQAKNVKSKSTSSRFILQVDPQDSPLPVELTELDATAEGRQVRLSWQTASETNNAGFLVEQKMQNGFQQIGFVEGAGTTVEPQSYQFTTGELEYGKRTFRLRQVDLDGTRHATQTVTAQVRLSEKYAIKGPYPNPVQERTTFDVTVKEKQNITVEVYDVLGRRVERVINREVEPQNTKHLTIDARRLASGLYVVRVNGDEFSVTRKMQVVR